MSRALTSQELQILRSDGLATKLFAIIDQPVTVFSCRVNQTFSGSEPIAQITYNNASGNMNNVLSGMTVLVGSTAGAWDKGLARVRKTWTSSIAYIGETSEIEWTNGLYLTVIDEFSIWPRHLRMIGETPYMDYDIPYSDQHNNFNPVVVMGPDRVVKLNSASVNINLDASPSWAFGSTITQYAWGVVSGSGTLTNANTATPILTVTTPGRIVLRCTVTAANGKSSTGYRTIYVYDDSTTLTEVQLDDLTGNLDQGGYEFSVLLPKPVSIVPRDYLKVILFAEEYPQSIGFNGAENILAIGWLDEKECMVDEQSGQSRLAVKGAQYWLGRMMAFPTGVENTSSTPTQWTQIQGLTVDKAIWHLLYWRSTLPNCADVILSGDTRIAPAFRAVGNLWQQIKLIAEESILATPFCDSYNRFLLQVHPNLRTAAARTNIPIIMSLSKDDYESVEVSIRSTNVAQYEVSGIGQNNEPILAKSPGKVFGRFGQILSKEGLLFSNNQNALETAGLLFTREKRLYDFTIHLISPNRVISLVPFGFLSLVINEADTPAKITFSGNVIPYRVEYSFSNGILKQTVFAEPEVFPSIAQNIIVPATPIVGTPEFSLPDFELPTWPALTPGRFSPPLIPGDDPLPPEEGATCPVNAPANGPYIWSMFYTLVSNSTYRVNLPIRVVIRSSNHDNKTVWGIRGRFLKLNQDTNVWEETNENTFYNIYAYNSAGQRIATGLKDTVSDWRYRTGTFQPPAAAEIAYIGVEIEADLLRPTTIYPEVEAGHFWDDWGREHGELSWGYLGAGIWAFIKNAKLTYNYSWNVFTKLRLGDYYEYYHVPFVIKQKVHASQDKGNILWAQGQLRSDALGWTELWYDDFADGLITPPYLWFVGKESQALGRAYTHITTAFEIRPSGQTQIVMQHYIECWRKARYKIELQTVELWNVCPVPKEG
ncbi:hypothetical protein BECAL_01795 [Bellilinea caldifistulae]|uniref:Uncharacterized protein n=1 Tax=Bellilinea caldifistulae TaxID=360411 RepID=A0A0P6X4X1_9CHLR|nr:hypothetical protein [Bellilinea caldifistulae]KPL74984.1 hypothetical protein AC812_10750 [Bellilinea caldifistulae]GAP10622.1 hypothetical protein BECAL_01795 [Bellilinea caldifistulae]